MAIGYEEILELSETMLEQASSEVERRTGISRAYYACFHACRGTIKTLELEEKKARGSHKTVIKTLKSQHDHLCVARQKSLRVAGIALQNFKLYRERADYDLHLDVTVEDVHVAKAQVEHLLGQITNAIGTDEEHLE